MYAIFRPAKGSTTTLKLLKYLCIILDALLLLFTAWNIVNICYPFWGWIMYASIWVGIVPYVLFYWLIKRFSLRSFIVAKIRPGDQLLSDGLHDLKHLGFLFSVWDKPDSLTLGYYHKGDTFWCPRKRHVILGHRREFNTWLGWLVVLSTDAIPLVLLAALACAGYFLGIGTILFFLMGFSLATQIYTTLIRFEERYLWKDQMFLDGKMCTPKFLSAIMCILEGPEGELLLTHYMVVMFDHYTRRNWFIWAADSTSCSCCTSQIDPAFNGLEA